MFKPESIDALLAEHVWEHLTYEEGIIASKHCYEFLKPSGYIRCAVPDKNFRNEWYQKIVQIGGPGPADHPAATTPLFQILLRRLLRHKLFYEPNDKNLISFPTELDQEFYWFELAG